MHYQSEFQSDPFQDRPAARTGQERVELETWPFVALVETGTTAPARCVGAVAYLTPRRAVPGRQVTRYAV